MKRSKKRFGETVTVEVDTKKLLKLTVLIVMIAAALLSVGLFILRRIPVKYVEVQGISQYDANALRMAAGIGREEKLYRLDKKEIEERLLRECLYLKSVKIERSFQTLTFVVEERRVLWYLDIAGDYYVLDEELFVVDSVKDEQSLKDRGLAKLVLPNVSSVICGEFPVFGMRSDRTEEANHYEIRMTCEILSLFQNSAFQLTELDLESRFDIQAVAETNYRILFGDYHELAEKIRNAQRALELNRDQYPAGLITASDLSAVVFKQSTLPEEEEIEPSQP